MCGIFAIINPHNYDVENVKKYFNYGKKRGPEYSSFNVIDNFVTLGFHRLAINGLNDKSNQPIQCGNHILICNGEIYNYKELKERFNFTFKTDSDCEIILHLYNLLGADCVRVLDGVFSFVLYDIEKQEVLIGRDPLGVRPLFISYMFDGLFGFSSDVKPLLFNKEYRKIKSINQITPGSFMILKNYTNKYIVYKQEKYYDITNNSKILDFPYFYGKNFYMAQLYDRLLNSVKKRVENCERPIACLLSGGLDSSIIAALVNRFYKEKTGNSVETYSIGLEGSEDLKYSSIVSNHIKSKHTQIIFKNEDFVRSIPDVIRDIESYDTTTVRASVGNWNIGKYISEHSEAKVVFNGDGADELMGGYLYFHLCPNDTEFDNECRRLLDNISYFDVLRSDKGISSHGLEPRTPFLDKELVKFYLSIPKEYRCHTNTQGECEKYFFRKMIEDYDSELIPHEILYRRKEAFSDGVSSKQESWYQIIQKYISDNLFYNDDSSSDSDDGETNRYDNHNLPTTQEQEYYRNIFNKEFPFCHQLIPYFWMPKYVNQTILVHVRYLFIINKN